METRVSLNRATSRIVITKSRAFVVPIVERRQRAGSIKDKRRPTGSGVVDRAFLTDHIVRECLSLIVRARCDHGLSHRIEGGSVPSGAVGHQGAISGGVVIEGRSAAVRIFSAGQLPDRAVGVGRAVATGVDADVCCPAAFRADVVRRLSGSMSCVSGPTRRRDVDSTR